MRAKAVPKPRAGAWQPGTPPWLTSTSSRGMPGRWGEEPGTMDRRGSTKWRGGVGGMGGKCRCADGGRRAGYGGAHSWWR